MQPLIRQWSTFCDALDGMRRFSDFQTNLDTAKNLLSARLKGLVEQGILQTVPAADGGAQRNTC
jgi:DNA-binding HxlR family transcriptional regulator